MPVNAEGRKYLTELLAGEMSYSDDTATNFSYASIPVGGSTSVDNIGVPMIWVDGNSQFEVYIAQDIAAAITAGNSPLPDGSVIAVTVGDAYGKGLNKADTDLTVADTTMTALYRGDATLLESGIEWGSAAAPAQALFLAQLEEQRITLAAEAAVVTPAYTS